MSNTKIFTRKIALAGAVTLLLGSSALAQDRSYPRTSDQTDNRGYANRTVEGTVASVQRDRDGDRVRLTNGMDVFVPNSITSMNQGRRFGASMLQRGDVVRMNVYSREGDGRDAQVRSLELLQTGSGWNSDHRMNGSGWNSDHRMNGTVISMDRRGRSLVMQTDNGQTINVDLNGRGNSYGNIRRGDRISVSGRMNGGTVIAEDVRLNNIGQSRRY
jgi:hypothetical protein